MNKGIVRTLLIRGVRPVRPVSVRLMPMRPSRVLGDGESPKEDQQEAKQGHLDHKFTDIYTLRAELALERRIALVKSPV